MKKEDSFRLIIPIENADPLIIDYKGQELKDLRHAAKLSGKTVENFLLDFFAAEKMRIDSEKQRPPLN